MRSVPEIFYPFARAAEADRERAYRDGGGVWTIGTGHTGPEVHEGLVWPKSLRDAALRADADKAAGLLASRVKAAVIDTLSDHQYSALLSFVFNLGANPKWQIWKRLNAGQLGAVPDEISRFHFIVHDDGTKEDSPGLRNRRNAEVLFWNTPDDTHPAAAIAAAAAVPSPSSGYTSQVETPAAPADAKPVSSSTSFRASCGAALASGAAWCAQALPGVKDGVKGVADQLEPLKDHSSLAAHAFTAMSGVVAAIVIVVPVLIWISKKRVH